MRFGGRPRLNRRRGCLHPGLFRSNSRNIPTPSPGNLRLPRTSTRRTFVLSCVLPRTSVVPPAPTPALTLPQPLHPTRIHIREPAHHTTSPPPPHLSVAAFVIPSTPPQALPACACVWPTHRGSPHWRQSPPAKPLRHTFPRAGTGSLSPFLRFRSLG